MPSDAVKAIQDESLRQLRAQRQSPTSQQVTLANLQQRETYIIQNLRQIRDLDKLATIIAEALQHRHKPHEIVNNVIRKVSKLRDKEAKRDERIKKLKALHTAKKQKQPYRFLEDYFSYEIGHHKNDLDRYESMKPKELSNIIKTIESCDTIPRHVGIEAQALEWLRRKITVKLGSKK